MTNTQNQQVTLGDGNIAGINTCVTLIVGIKHDPVFFKNASGRIIAFMDGNVLVRICNSTRSIKPIHLKISALQ